MPPFFALSDMLSRRENEVMNAVYCLCDGGDGCLISAVDVMNILPLKRGYTTERVEQTLDELKREGYLDIISSERKGEKMFVISLKDSGLAYKSDKLKRRREMLYRLLTAFVGAFATFVFGLIIKAIFKG